MIGRRRTDNLSDSPEFRWSDTAPGDYWKLVTAGGEVYWHFVSPLGEHGSSDKRWSVTEHEDLTITVQPSIFFNRPRGWHGYLEHGVWRRV